MPDETPVGTATRDPPQPDRATDVSTDPPLDLPTLRGHQSRDLCRARARQNSHGGSYRPEKKDSPALWAKSMPDISNFSRVGAAHCRLLDIFEPLGDDLAAVVDLPDLDGRDHIAMLVKIHLT